MPKKPKTKRKKSKPGPREERLIISIDPQEAVKALLNLKKKSSPSR